MVVCCLIAAATATWHQHSSQARPAPHSHGRITQHIDQPEKKAKGDVKIPYLFAQKNLALYEKSDFQPLPFEDDVSVVFAIKTEVGGAHIRLSPNNESGQNKSCSDCIDVIIGSIGNTAIDINYGGARSNSQYVTPLYKGRVLSPTEYRYFWINYNGRMGEVTVGLGKSVYRNIVVSYRSDSLQQFWDWRSLAEGKPNPIAFPVKYVAFTAWLYDVEYSDITISASSFERGTVNAPVVTNFGLAYVQFHYPDKFELDSKSFEVVFECQSLSEVMIGFLHKYKFRMEDEQAYEICLDWEYETEREPGKGRNPISMIQYGTGHGGRRLATSNRTDVISPSQFRPFWIQMKNRQLTVGTGIKVGENVWMQTPDDQPVPPTGHDTVWLSTASYFFAASVKFLRVKSVTSIVNVDFTANDFDKWTPDHNHAVPVTYKTGTEGEYLPYLGSTECHDPACIPNDRKYVMERLTVRPRFQWWHHGAYCGELAIQATAMSYGAYLSQKQIRKVAPNNFQTHSYGSPTLGYEVTDINIERTMDRLGILYQSWDKNSPQPQIKPFLRWLKKQLVKSYPVIMAVRFYEGLSYDHMEPIYGYRSNHPLDDPNVYIDDVISNVLGVGSKRYYRTIDTLVDTHPTPSLYSGGNNCTLSQSECIFIDRNFGYAIMGLEDPHFRSIETSINVSDNGMEPFPFEVPTTATVTVHGPLVPGQAYTIYRWDAIDDFPRNSKYESSAWTYSHSFVAHGVNHTWTDPVSFLSTSTIYYVTVRDEPATRAPTEAPEAPARPHHRHHHHADSETVHDEPTVAPEDRHHHHRADSETVHDEPSTRAPTEAPEDRHHHHRADSETVRDEPAKQAPTEAPEDRDHHRHHHHADSETEMDRQDDDQNDSLE